MAYNYKLSKTERAEIRSKYKSTKHLNTRDPTRHSYASLCAEYKISRDTLWKILNSRHYDDTYGAINA